jgi:hypothetical protein
MRLHGFTLLFCGRAAHDFDSGVENMDSAGGCAVKIKRSRGKKKKKKRAA